MKKPLLIYTNWLPGNLRGMCFPPLVAIRLDHYNEQWCKRHEFAHWVQYRRRGWLGYVFGYLWRLIRFGYKAHPWEIEARRRGWRPRREEQANKNPENALENGQG